jgi:hypothetical protein
MGRAANACSGHPIRQACVQRTAEFMKFSQQQREQAGSCTTAWSIKPMPEPAACGRGRWHVVHGMSGVVGGVGVVETTGIAASGWPVLVLLDMVVISGTAA